MKATEQYFPEVLFIMLYKVVLTFESGGEILKCVNIQLILHLIFNYIIFNYIIFKDFQSSVITKRTCVLFFGTFVDRIPPFPLQIVEEIILV